MPRGLMRSKMSLLLIRSDGKRMLLLLHITKRGVLPGRLIVRHQGGNLTNRRERRAMAGRRQ
jgi:hypothetical protein